MAKTIQEQIADMEARCSQLEELHKLFEKMVKNEYGVDANHIVLGIRFLWNFVSEFDYEKKSITFFSNKPFGNINEIKGLLKRKSCFVVLLIIQSSLLLSILLNSYVIFNNSKMRMS